MRPPAIAMLEKPLPSPSAVHSSCGPLSDHSVSKPVSVEMASRFGPRHVGQSFFEAGASPPIAVNDSAALINPRPVNNKLLHIGGLQAGGEGGGLMSDEM